jgi:hypothetical protein
MLLVIAFGQLIRVLFLFNITHCCRWVSMGLEQFLKLRGTGVSVSSPLWN